LLYWYKSTNSDAAGAVEDKTEDKEAAMEEAKALAAAEVKILAAAARAAAAAAHGAGEQQKRCQLNCFRTFPSRLE
jgi:hypothetical protein